MSNYAIRNRRTGELIQKYSNPIEAEIELRNQELDPAEFEVAERTSDNIYTQGPDGRTYIVGIKHTWIRYEA